MISQAQHLLCDRWTLLILDQALRGVHRFSAWQTKLGVSNSVLVNRLADLTTHRLLERVGEGRNTHYPLTEGGEQTWPVLVALYAWQRRWLSARDAGYPGPVVRHERCRRDCVPRMGCQCSPLPVTLADLTLAVAPTAQHPETPRLHPRATSRAASRPHTLLPATLDAVGDRWSGAVLVAAMTGARRFTEFEHRLGLPAMVLTERLQRFVRLGVVRSVAGQGYGLTPKGSALLEPLVLMSHWGEKFLPDDGEGAPRWRHPRCGRMLTPVLRCDHCHATLTRRETEWS